MKKVKLLLLFLTIIIGALFVRAEQVSAATECSGFADCDTKGAFNDSADGIAIGGTCAQKGNVWGNDSTKDRTGDSCANGDGKLERLGVCDNGTITTAGGAAGGSGGGPSYLADSRTTYKCVSNQPPANSPTTWTYKFSGCRPLSNGQVRVNYTVESTTAIGGGTVTCKNGIADASSSNDASFKQLVETNKAAINQCCAQINSNSPTQEEVSAEIANHCRELMGNQSAYYVDGDAQCNAGDEERWVQLPAYIKCCAPSSGQSGQSPASTTPTGGGTESTDTTGSTGGGAGGNSDGICAGPVPYSSPYTWNTGVKLNSPGHPKHGSDIQCAYSTDNDCSNGGHQNLCYGDTVDGKRACVNVKDCASALGEGWSNTEPTCEGDETVVKTTWNCVVHDPSVYIQPCNNNTTCYRCAPKQNTAGSCAEAIKKNPLPDGWITPTSEIIYLDPNNKLDASSIDLSDTSIMECDDPELDDKYIIPLGKKTGVKETGTGADIYQYQVCAYKCGDACTTDNDCDTCDMCDIKDGQTIGTCKPDPDKADDPACGGNECDYIDCSECIDSKDQERCRLNSTESSECKEGALTNEYVDDSAKDKAVCDKCTSVTGATWTKYTSKTDGADECARPPTPGSGSYGCGTSMPDKTCTSACSYFNVWSTQSPGTNPCTKGAYETKTVTSCAENSAYCQPLKTQYEIINDTTGGDNSYESCLSRDGATSKKYFKTIFNRDVSNNCVNKNTDFTVPVGENELDLTAGTEASICINPCECEVKLTDTYTVHYEIGDEYRNDGPEDNKFFKNPDTGDCEAKWSASTDANGIKSNKNVWGDGGTNGRWRIESFTGAGWTLNKEDGECRFECEGKTNGAPCYNVPLNVKMKFIPDLRVATYNDPNFQALPTTSATGGDNCSIGSVESSGELTSNFALDNNKDKRNFRFYLGGPGQSSPYQGIAKEKSLIDRQIFPTPFTNTGYYTEMTSGETLKNQAVNFSNQITNQYNKAEDTGYWTCTCPYGNQADPDSQNCQFTFTPANDSDICTTKRVYTSFRNCYTSAWWQVSGGNVYAYSNIVDFVPTQIIGQGTDQQCTSDAYKCVDATPPTGAANDFPQAETTGAAGEESCTPRVIRGRTPCKSDGPSNSAGIALTQNGSVTTVDYTDCRINGNCANINNDILKVEELARRVTERSNIHALYEGNYTGEHSQNVDNPSGLQAKIGNSRVLPYQKANYTQRTDSNYGQVPPQSGNADNGFKPPREDYRYFVALFGGYDKLTDQAGVEVSYGPETNGVREFNSSGLTLQNISDWCNREASVISQTDTEDTRVCHIPGNLTITNDAPWRVAASDGVTRSYTFFVEGNLTLKGNNDINNSSSVTAVDIGNFLGFIVNGSIFVDHNVGITMTDPTSDTAVADPLLNACWEGQSATLPGVNLPQADTNTHNNYSTAGSVEGVFIANGNFMVDSIINNANRSADAICRFDRRFIAQGSIISWGNVYLLRDFNNREGACQGDFYGAYNNRVPAETFIYRPDLVRNTPDWMKRQSVVYTEV